MANIKIRNIQRQLKRGIALGLLGIGTFVSVFGDEKIAYALEEGSSEVTATDAETDASADTSTYSEDEYVNERLETGYSKISKTYTKSAYTGDTKVYEMADVISDGEEYLTEDTNSYEGSAKVLALTSDNTIKLNIEVLEDGLYYLNFNYLSTDDSILPIEMEMKIDGDYPFYECRNVELEALWEKGESETDRYGNEVVTVPTKIKTWQSMYLYDSSYRHSDPLCLELTKGTHEIELTVEEGEFLLGNIELVAPTCVSAYEGSEIAEGDSIIEIQGEDYTLTNDSSIHAVVEYDTSLTPYSTTDTVLNTLDSDSFDSAGMRVSYEFEVENDGYYYIATNYRQSDKTDFPVFVDVAIDGSVPNKEFKDYQMAYTTKYKTTTLTDDEDENLSVYLEKGTHTISFTISMDPICEVMETLEEISSNVNDLALEITKVAGTNSDKYRDLTLTNYIPDVQDRLYEYANALRDMEESCLVYSDSDKNVAVMSSMIIAANQLEDLADNPNDIPYRVSELSTSTNSVNHYLAQTIDNLISNCLAIDRIWIYQDGASLPKKPGVFKSIAMNIQRFVASFTEKAYSTSNTDPDHLQVWVNRSNQYVQIMQKMIDEEFTPQTGIEVDISVMPDQYKLVLANSSGNAPDVATGINYTIPYELAVRGALVDMTQFDDFQEVASPYEPGYFMTGTIGDSIYSMPETTNFWVLFVRTDVMEKLGLEIPQTMDDVIAMLPELQMRGLNFYYPTAGMILMRNFHGTTPLIVQNGGSLYYDEASLGTALGEEEAVNGFTLLTDLFTLYNLPVNVDNFYQHFRNGDYPIGIADYATYNMMINAAPELEGSWTIELAPGTLTTDEDGNEYIDRSYCGCAESTVMFNSDGDNDTISEREQMAWEFVKWWSSTDVQAEFGQTIQITYGDEYIWPTANMEAFDMLPINSHDKEVIEEFASNVVDVARVPGTYLLERELSNAFNDIVVNGETAQTRIDEAVKTINREIERKLEEFGYTDSEGNVIEEYNIPTIESEKELLGRE